MPRFAVYQARFTNFRNTRLAENLFVRYPQNWPLIAVVQAHDLEHAYTLTNHLEQDWWDNLGVVWVREPKEHRSTSVGDVIVDQAGHVHVVAPLGFKHFHTLSACPPILLNATEALTAIA